MTSRVRYHRHPADAAAAAHIADTSAAHAASAISADSTTVVGTGTDVQAVLEELDNAIAALVAAQSDFIPCSVTSGGAVTTEGDYPTITLGSGDTDTLSFAGRLRAAPSAVSLIAIANGGAGGDIVWTVATDFAAIGEAYNANSDTAGATTTIGNNSNIFAVSLLDAFTGAAAGDFFGLVFTRDGPNVADTYGNLDALGLLVTY